MRKPLAFTSVTAITLAVFLFHTPISSCTKTKTVTDTVTKTVTDTVIKTVTDTIPAVNLQSGLVAYYPFNGNVKDSSGNNNNGTAFGNLQFSTDVNNIGGGAALFDGSSSYILVQDNGSLSTSSITISMQFYENSATHQTLVGKLNFSDATSIVFGMAPFGGNGENPQSVNFASRGPAAACGIADGIGASDVISGDTIQLHTWYEVTCVFDQGVQRIYWNGKLKGALEMNFSTLKQCTQAQLVIGAWYQADPLYFSGKMDELRIYNRALNYREIQTLAKGF
jgi:hypothetical protein